MFFFCKSRKLEGSIPIACHFNSIFFLSLKLSRSNLAIDTTSLEELGEK